MPSATMVHTQMVKRVRTSGLSITVFYPSVRLSPTGAGASAAPISPLTAPAQASAVVDPVLTTTKPPVTVPCLWTDTYRHVFADLAENSKRTNRIGWVEGAHALVTVVVEDVAVDPTQPLGPTIFTGCDYILYMGRKFKILEARPEGAAFAVPAVLYMYVQGVVEN